MPLESTSVEPPPLPSPSQPPLARRHRVRIGRRVVPFLIVSVVLFLVSLSQPAMLLDGSDTGAKWEGLLLLSMGWVGVIGGVFGWLANPALLVAWIGLLVRRNRIAAVSSVLAIGLSLTFLRETTWERDESGMHTANITGYAIGYYLWIASMATALAGSLFAMTIRDCDSRSPTHTNLGTA